MKLIFFFKVYEILCKFQKCKENVIKFHGFQDKYISICWSEFLSNLTRIHVIGRQRLKRES